MHAKSQLIRSLITAVASGVFLTAASASAQSRTTATKKPAPPVPTTVTPTASEPTTAIAARGRPASTPAGRAVNGALRTALANANVRNAVRAEVLRQLRVRPPLAIVNGYWVGAIDLVPVYQLTAVRPALVTALGVNGPQLISEAGVSADRMVISFVPAAFGQIVLPEFMADITSTLGVDVLKTHMTDFVVGPVLLIFVLGGVGAGLTIMITDMVVKWSEWLSMKYNDYTTSTGPTKDYDGDGIPNKDDTDDDNDGVPDKDDNYPYDPLASICDCGRPKSAIAFTTSNAGNLLPEIIAALSTTQARTSRAISLGAVMQGQPNTLSVIF